MHRFARITLLTVLTAWLALAPALEASGVVGGVAMRPPVAHACGATCQTCCCSAPADACCSAPEGGCGQASRPWTSPLGACDCCAPAGVVMVFVGPEAGPEETLVSDRLDLPPDTAAPDNIFQPPTPPPRSA